MNRITTTLGNLEGSLTTQGLYNFGEKFFKNFSEQEQNFVKENIYSFECFFATKPTAALKSFLFPVGSDMSESQRQWNGFMEKILKNFQDTSLQRKGEFLENFYHKILEIAQVESSQSMKYRHNMKEIVQKFFAKKS